MLARTPLPLLAAVVLTLGVALAPRPAEARVGVFVGGYFGFPGYYYPPAYYYPPYAYYYPSYYYYPPAYTYPPPPSAAAPAAYSNVPPPPPPSARAPAAYTNAPPPPSRPATAAKPSAGTPPGGNCHDFQTSEPAEGGGSQPATHTACQQPDGTWEIVR